MNYDVNRLEWVKQHLDITHNEMSAAEAGEWRQLLKHNAPSFFQHGIAGFVLRRRAEKGQLDFSGKEIGVFCEEFAMKISLAADNVDRDTGLPLFEVTGITKTAAATSSAVPAT